MKHQDPSLLERAAELYDFGAALRAQPIPAAAAAEPVPQPMPARPDHPGGIVSVDRALLAERGCLLPDQPVSGLGEEIRLIKRRILAGIDRRADQPEAKRRTVLLASAGEGEGKSFCALNLAISLAGEREVEALLIDGDFSKPELPTLLGIGDAPGLVDALTNPSLDPEMLVIRTDIPGLSVLPAGQRANNVPELLGSERAGELFARLAAADPRRVLLLDSPPVLASSVASILAAHAGEAAVVVRADRTTEADLREAVGLLSACGEVSLLLNGAAFAATGKRYGGYERQDDAD